MNNNLIQKLMNMGSGTHLVPVLLVIEDGNISIEPIENLNARLSTITPEAATAPEQATPELPIEDMKKALAQPPIEDMKKALLDPRKGGHFSMSFKQFCFDIMREGVTPEELHAKLISGKVSLGEENRVPSLSTLQRWDQAGIHRSRKKGSRRKRVNFDKKLHRDVVEYFHAHPETSTSAVARRFNVSSSSVWRWVKEAEAQDLEEGRRAEAHQKAAQESLLSEKKEDFFAFVKDDPSLLVSDLKELFPKVPDETLTSWMREAKRAIKGNPAGLAPKDKYTEAERRDYANRFARRVRGGSTMSVAAEKVGITRSVLARWCKKFDISLDRKPTTTKKLTPQTYFQFCLDRTPEDWTKLGSWLLKKSGGSTNVKAHSAQCEEMAAILSRGSVPSVELTEACYKHWANAEMALGFKS
mgnify:CR=1 FL=1